MSFPVSFFPLTKSLWDKYHSTHFIDTDTKYQGDKEACLRSRKLLGSRIEMWTKVSQTLASPSTTDSHSLQVCLTWATAIPEQWATLLSAVCSPNLSPTCQATPYPKHLGPWLSYSCICWNTSHLLHLFSSYSPFETTRSCLTSNKQMFIGNYVI